MKKNKSLIIGGIFCCFFTLMVGCSSTKLVEIWRDSSFQSPPLSKMLVISVSKNSVQRRLWEDAFSTELAKHDVAATPSYRSFPDTVPDTNQVIRIMRSNSFDGVLVISWLPYETKTQHVRGYHVMNQQNWKYDTSMYKFITFYEDIAYAGYVDTQKIDIRAIDVWVTKNIVQMIWSATSKTPEPNAIQAVRPEIVKLVMSELTKQRIIASER
ncbi:MAG: hypothetical protein ABSC53_12590 [Bacteroidota bacterium]